ncbi:MAG: DbpA RNA binding domain-containing protein, partial [Bacteroidota bacterium]
GIDVDDITHVIHFNLPDNEEYYTHRSGRTARAGKTGESVALVTSNERTALLRYAKALRIKVNRLEAPSYAELMDHAMLKLAERFQNEPLSKEFKDFCKPEWIQAFEQMDREELLMHLLQNEFQNWAKYIAKAKREKNRTDSPRDRRDDRRDDRRKDRDRKDRNRNQERDSRDRKSNDREGVQFYINIGRRDQVEKMDLLHFLEEQGDLPQEQIFNVQLNSNFSLFSVDKKLARKVKSRFNDLIVNGRPLKVKRDEPSGHMEPPKKRRKASSKERKRKKKK